jgi:hypothetical protein
VHRFLEWLPEELRKGPLRTSRANARQLAFPELDSQYKVVSAGERNAGRGLTVQNLHCSELARWPGNPAEILAGLRAAMAPGAELIVESTPDGVGGCFHEEWRKARRNPGWCAHFFHGGWSGAIGADAVDENSLTEEEQELRQRHRLDLEGRLVTGGRFERIFADWHGRSMPKTKKAASGPAANRCLRWQRSRSGC